ncbi:MAG: hypothetical protein K2Q14_03555, partial [Gammaproteobacteria bacterium]|nr:hypothetical protein [Gammaproteobacteria bacterium]
MPEKIELVSFDNVDKSVPIALYFTGSFNPPTTGHLMALIEAASELEAKGYTVDRLYISPSHDDYINKYKKYDPLSNKQPRPIINADLRLEMFNALLSQMKEHYQANSAILVQLNKLKVSSYESDLDRFVDHHLLVKNFSTEKDKSRESKKKENRQIVYLAGADLPCC